MELNRDTVASLANPLYQVWNAIGYDTYDVYQEMGETLDPEGVIEMCIDANRLSTFVDGAEGQAAEDLVSALIREHGYDKVLKFLAEVYPMC